MTTSLIAAAISDSSVGHLVDAFKAGIQSPLGIVGIAMAFIAVLAWVFWRKPADSSESSRVRVFVFLCLLIAGMAIFVFASTVSAPEQPDDPPPAPTETTIPVPAFAIRTTSDDAKHVAGDDEIHTDDWTGVEIRYWLSHTDTSVDLDLEWFAQEKNSDHSPGDTRYRSAPARPFRVFNLRDHCPAPGRIVRLEGVTLEKSASNDFRGERHHFQDWPGDVGSLSAIEVSFDKPGRQDLGAQGLRARLQAFSVVVAGCE